MSDISYNCESKYIKAYAQLYGKKKPVNKFRRDWLPVPSEYYQRQFDSLKPVNGWALVRCVFHDDKRASLSVSVEHGGFKCHACGAKGGDVLAFHMQLTGMSFQNAAKDLGAWEVNNG